MRTADLMPTGRSASDGGDPRAKAVLEVLAGDSLAVVAAREGVAPELLERWVASFVEGGTQAISGIVKNDYTPERFLTVLAHEIRTPLAAVIAGLRLLADPRLAEATYSDIHEMINQRLTQLSLLSGDVLDAASVVLGRLPLNISDLDLNAVVASTIITHGNPRLRLTTSDPVPVRADKHRLEQILTNMIESALRHGLGPVRFSVAQEPHYARVLVTAHSKATVSAREATSWFEPFEAADTGNGLGLYVVRALTVAHGGNSGLDATTCTEGGSDQDLHFWVRLPLDHSVRTDAVVSDAASLGTNREGT